MNRSALRLHPGSRWHGDAIFDGFGESIRIVRVGDSKEPCVDFSGEMADARAYAADVLALLTDAGLNPYANALQKLTAAITRSRTLSSETAATQLSDNIDAGDIQEELDAAEKLQERAEL